MGPRSLPPPPRRFSQRSFTALRKAEAPFRMTGWFFQTYDIHQSLRVCARRAKAIHSAPACLKPIRKRARHASRTTKWCGSSGAGRTAKSGWRAVADRDVARGEDRGPADLRERQGVSARVRGHGEVRADLARRCGLRGYPPRRARRGGRLFLLRHGAGRRPPRRRAPIDPARYVPKTLKTELSRRSRLLADECITIGLSLTKALARLAPAGAGPSRHQAGEHHLRRRRAEDRGHRTRRGERAGFVRRHRGLRAAGRAGHARRRTSTASARCSTKSRWGRTGWISPR